MTQNYQGDAKCGACGGPLECHRDAVCEKCVPESQYFADCAGMQAMYEAAEGETMSELGPLSAFGIKEARKSVAFEDTDPLIKRFVRMLDGEIRDLKGRLAKMRNRNAKKIAEYDAVISTNTVDYMMAQERIEGLRAGISMMISSAGHPDPKEGCRLAVVHGAQLLQKAKEGSQ